MSLELKNSYLFCVVTGLEHSGTTIFANALKSAPRLMGGFECGIAFPIIPQPFLNNLSRSGEHWGLSKDQVEDLVKMDVNERYAYLCYNSPLVKGDELLVDKTPVYCLHLTEIMSSLDVPFIVVEKTFDNWMKSNKKRALMRPTTDNNYYAERWKTYKKSLALAQATFDNLFIIQFENIEEEIKDAFEWLDLPFKEEYLSGAGYRQKLFERAGVEPGRELFKEELK